MPRVSITKFQRCKCLLGGMLDAKEETDTTFTICLQVARYFGTCQTNMSSAELLQEYYYGLSTQGFQVQFPYFYDMIQTHLRGCCKHLFVHHLFIRLKIFLVSYVASSALSTMDSVIENHGFKFWELIIHGRQIHQHTSK